MTNDAGQTDDKDHFLDQYLGHLERQDSREGATKWLMMAAMAAVLWQLSNVFFRARQVLVIELVGFFLALYFVIQFGGILFSNEGGSSRIRFLPRSGKSAEAKLIGVLIARFLTTGVIFVYFFTKVPWSYRLGVALPPLIFGVAALYLVTDLNEKYEVLKPRKDVLWEKLLISLVFLMPMVWGLYGVFEVSQVLRVLVDASNLTSIQSAGLIVVFLFLAEKYARTLRVDGEISAVRRIWRRHGIGEMTNEEAAKELRLVVAGASLNEVISHDVNALSKRLQELDELEMQARLELNRFASLPVGQDDVAKSALQNSLSKRRSDIQSELEAIDGQCAIILLRVKRLLKDDTLSNGEASELKGSLEERCKARRFASEELIESIRCASL